MIFDSFAICGVFKGWFNQHDCNFDDDRKIDSSKSP